MEYFKCKKCDNSFPKEFFHKKTCAIHGIASYCKVCANEYARKYRNEVREVKTVKRDEYLRMTGLAKKDYCRVYEFLQKIGYDIYSEKSIHEQFCLKYGLPTKVARKSIKRIYTPKDCQKKTPTS